MMRFPGFRFAVLTIVSLSALALGSCDTAQSMLKHDRDQQLETQDFRDSFASKVDDVTEEDKAAQEKRDSNIPELQPYIAESSTAFKSFPLVSISVNQSVPLRDILFELAKQADYDLELDPRITGSIIFTAREKPFDQVIERIADVAGLRYKFSNDALRVELDTPYVETYNVSYLNTIRTSSGSINNAVAVVSGDGADTGSGFSAEVESVSDFWAELEANLEQILGSQQFGLLKTSADPALSVADQEPNVLPVVPNADGSVNVQPPQATLQVSSLPSEEGGEAGEEAAATFSVNRNAGIISVYANGSKQEEVAHYLKRLKRASSSQVLIEAKILEVTLNDNFQTGVDWRFLELLPNKFTLNYINNVSNFGPTRLGSSGSFTGSAALAGSDGIVAGFSSIDFQAVLGAVSQFGSVRALASPRLTVLNNQSAVLNIARNEVFFEIDVETTPGTDGSDPLTTLESEIKTVPIGVLMNVIPSIDIDSQTVDLSLRPTITNTSESVTDPGAAFGITRAVAELVAAGADEGTIEDLSAIASNIPIVAVQELDTNVKIRSGQTVMMGGLLQDTITNSKDGVPGLADASIFGSLFSQNTSTIEKTEIVVFIKATILEQPEDSVHSFDKHLYNKFSGDRRPLRF